MENNKRKIYVIGHKNPDTDSICSAIAYADIKTERRKIPFTRQSVPVRSTKKRCMC